MCEWLATVVSVSDRILNEFSRPYGGAFKTFKRPFLDQWKKKKEHSTSMFSKCLGSTQCTIIKYYYNFY